jgi:hypothetical protein
MLRIARGQIGRAIVGVTLAIIAGVVLLGAILLITDGLPAALLAWSGAATAAILLVPMLLRRRFEAGEPLTLALLAVLVGVTLKAPYVYLSSNDPVVRGILLDLKPPDLLAGMTLILTGMAALSAGYLLRLPRWRLRGGLLASRTELRPLRFAVTSLLVMCAAGVAMYLFVSEFGLVLAGAGLDELSGKRFLDLEGSQFRAALGYHRWAISLAAILFCVAYGWSLRQAGARRLLCLAVATLAGAVAVGFAVFSSSRGSFAMLVMAALLITYYMRRGVSLAGATAVAAVTVVVLVGITVLRPARSDADWDRVDVAGEFAAITVGGRHFLDLGKTTHVVRAVPERIPLQYGRTLVTWAIAPVPRFLWPAKPAVGVGPLLGQQVYGTGLRGGVPPGFVAELYLNFHVAGVVLGMFALGIALRFLYESCRTELLAGNPNVVALYAMVAQTASIHLLTTDFSKFVVELLTQALPLLLIVALIAARSRDARTAP